MTHLADEVSCFWHHILNIISFEEVDTYGLLDVFWMKLHAFQVNYYVVLFTFTSVQLVRQKQVIFSIHKLLFP